MTPITEQKCPKCGAPMRFDPDSGLFVCDNCGNWERVEDLSSEAPAQGGNQATGHPASQGGSQATGHPASQGASQATGHPTSQGASHPTSQGGNHPTSQATGHHASHPAGQTSTPPDQSVPTELTGLNMDQLLAQAMDPDSADLPVYNCVSCGAEVIAPPEQVALTCPYCRNNIVLTDKISGKLRPDGVIPFRIQSKELPAAVRRFYRGKKLLPRGFFSDAKMGRITGIYVPFWVFDGRVSGTLRYQGVITKSHRHGDYIETQNKYYLLVRDAALDFKDLPVDAGSKMDDRLMDSLEPFVLEEAQSFDMRYLAGFTADRFDQTDSDLSSRAKKRMASSVFSLTHADAASGYTSVDPRGQSLNASLNARYLLFPVYMFDVSHMGKNYHFAVNGQTGKVVGELPSDDFTGFLYFAGHAGVVSAAILAFNIILYLAGH